MKILCYLYIPFRTQNATASNQVVFSDGLHVMSLPEGICERVVIGSQARLRIWCLRAYGFESLRSHFIKRSKSVPSVSFFCASGSCLEKRSEPRGLVPLCHCVTSPEGEWKRLSPFRSLARFLEIGECSPVSFFCAYGRISGKCSIQVLRKRGRRCGRGRHGRPWPCEWDVGREPDRDERSEPPTAAPPPGAIQTLK